ncbi:hypothetical protein DRJ00_07645 [Candidatus Aerophobetes bacterium]|uniref:Uncharacterized protein n=1 Tax=Aerophobetes bacterium TaxID=2030807 RepID=A0A497E2I2_UNCAE|nr:hypothetical protein [Candidatus Aerophobetes bacterium]RLE07712.1 MAG: hypothetical protein DRJ00_07645 [Candidatus Aerophobetes bacterium]
MAVGRFQVMATLQAARAFILGLPMDSAKSWGLNRAIFYAAAKRGFKKVQPPKEIILPRIKEKMKPELREKVVKTFKPYTLGDEMAYSVKINDKTYFLIGDRVQTPEDFSRQIESRFGENFEQAWEEAVNYCRKYDEGILRSQRYFYEMVYKPVRDKLAKQWTSLTRE